LVFFFSSRRRHTRFSRDWSSDVCSSDLGPGCAARPCRHENSLSRGDITPTRLPGTPLPILTAEAAPSAHCDTEHDSYVVRHEHRSEERRVGKECRSQEATQYEKKQKRTE